MGSKCSSRGKHPKCGQWKKEASNSPDKIQHWLSKGETNLGLITGHVNNLLVIDVDPKNGGDDSLVILWKEAGPLPSSNVVLTGSGGLHFYLKYTNENFKNGPIAPGIDLKTDGGYVVAPYSRHSSGALYTPIKNFNIESYLAGDYKNELFK